jgi:hypothetical protein
MVSRHLPGHVQPPAGLATCKSVIVQHTATKCYIVIKFYCYNMSYIYIYIYIKQSQLLILYSQLRSSCSDHPDNIQNTSNLHTKYEYSIAYIYFLFSHKLPLLNNVWKRNTVSAPLVTNMECL